MGPTRAPAFEPILDGGYNQAVMLRVVRSVSVVLNCAGNLIDSALFAEVCMKAKTHYIDLSDDFDTLSALHAMDGPAKENGVMLMGGIGWGCVAGDSLASYLSKKVTSPQRLELSIKTDSGGLTPGSLKHLRIENQKKKSFYVIQDGEPTKEMPSSSTIDFGPMGGGVMKVHRVRTGELWSAHVSTGIPNISTSVAGDQATASSTARAPTLAKEKDSSTPRVGASVVFGTVWGNNGSQHSAQLIGGEVTTFSAKVVCEMIRRILPRKDSSVLGRTTNKQHDTSGLLDTPNKAQEDRRRWVVPTGYQTPSQAFGIDLVDISDSRIEDVSSQQGVVPQMRKVKSLSEKRASSSAPDGTVQLNKNVWDDLPDDDFVAVVSVSDGWRGLQKLTLGDTMHLEARFIPVSYFILLKLSLKAMPYII